MGLGTFLAFCSKKLMDKLAYACHKALPCVVPDVMRIRSVSYDGSCAIVTMMCIPLKCLIFLHKNESKN